MFQGSIVILLLCPLLGVVCGCGSKTGTDNSSRDDRRITSRRDELRILSQASPDLRRRAPRTKPDKLLLRRFRFQNGSLREAVYALNRCGLDVCREFLETGSARWFVGAQGEPVIRADRLVSLDLENTTGAAVMDALVALHGEYACHFNDNGSVTLYPKTNSALSFRVPPFREKGIVIELLMCLYEVEPKVALQFPLLSRGGSSPIISIDFPGGSGRDFLDALVADQPGYTWHYGTGLPDSVVLVFNKPTPPYAKEVDVEFPVVSESALAFEISEYQITEQLSEDRSPRLIVTRKKRR